MIIRYKRSLSTYYYELIVVYLAIELASNFLTIRRQGIYLTVRLLPRGLI